MAGWNSVGVVVRLGWFALCTRVWTVGVSTAGRTKSVEKGARVRGVDGRRSDVIWVVGAPQEQGEAEESRWT